MSSLCIFGMFSYLSQHNLGFSFGSLRSPYFLGPKALVEDMGSFFSFVCLVGTELKLRTCDSLVLFLGIFR